MTQEEMKQENRQNRIFNAVFLAPFALMWIGGAGWTLYEYVQEKKLEKKEIKKAEEKKEQTDKSLSFAIEYNKINQR